MDRKTVAIRNGIIGTILMFGVVHCGGGGAVPPPATRKATIIAGQSNSMAPTGSFASQLPLALQGPQLSVPYAFRTYGSVIAPTPSEESWHPLQPTNSGVHGAEITYGAGRSATTSSAIIKFAISGSGLAANWLGQDRISECITWVQSQLAAYPDGPIELDSFYWIQGETDAVEVVDSTNYADNMATLASAVRAVWPDSKFIIHKLCPFVSRPSGNIALVRSGEDAFVAADGNADSEDTWVNEFTDGQPTLYDGLHGWSKPFQNAGYAAAALAP